jgi:hypothetical protein
LTDRFLIELTKMVTDELRRAAPHDILQAWQDGAIGYREAMGLTGCENLFELFQACRSSGVDLRRDLTSEETKVVDAVMADINGAPAL